MPFANFIPLIGSVIDSVGSIFGQGKANKANRDLAADQQKWNRQNANRQNQFNLEMWNRQNEYNHPLQQMARYSEAGLNPNLIYGTGSASAGNASPMSSAADVKGYDRAESRNVLEGFSAFSDFIRNRQLMEATDNLKVQRQVMEQEKIKKAYDTLDRAVGIQRKAFDLGLAKELRGTSVTAAQANAERAVQDARKSGAEADVSVGTRDSRIRRAEIQVDLAAKQLKGQELLNKLREIEAHLNEAGVQKGDNVFLRMLMQNKETRKYIDYFMKEPWMKDFGNFMMTPFMQPGHNYFK